MKKLVVDHTKCLNCGSCIALAPKTFFMGKNGKTLINKSSADSPKKIHEAILNCPAQAISLCQS